MLILKDQSDLIFTVLSCCLVRFQMLKFFGYSITCLKGPLKNRQNKGLNEGQKYCRMLPLEHSAILLTCIK